MSEQIECVGGPLDKRTLISEKVAEELWFVRTDNWQEFAKKVRADGPRVCVQWPEREQTFDVYRYDQTQSKYIYQRVEQ